MKRSPAPRLPAETVAFDSPEYHAFVAGFAARVKAGPLMLVFAGPTGRERGAALADLSDAARLPLFVVPLETRLAAREAQTLANLREDFDATSSTTAIVCFRHADGVLRPDEGSDTMPPPLDYIFQRARNVKGAVVLSVDDATFAAPLADRADVVVTFSPAASSSAA